MARNPLISAKRFKLINKRQSPMKWMAEYKPAMLATRDEAPSISRPSTLYWAKLGRDLHFLSLAERHVALLALYHPRVMEIHEQHMLQPFEAPHPLANSPYASGAALAPLRGTVEVAEELGILSKHPVVLLPDENHPDDLNREAFPYLGDLLLFLKDDQGAYCVNWSVKASREDFYARPNLRAKKNATSTISSCPVLSPRHRLEQTYFADAGIPTHFISAEELNDDVLYNLNSLCAKAQRPSTLPFNVEEQLILKLQNIVGTQTTVLSMLPQLTEQFACDRTDCLTTFYRAVWNRRIRLDLYKPILVNKPLKAERVDILVEHAHLFGR